MKRAVAFIPGVLFLSVALPAMDGVVYIPAERLYAVNARTGKAIWSTKVFENTDPRAALADGLIHVCAPSANGHACQKRAYPHSNLLLISDFGIRISD